jgi:NAD(P)-dependent dehydrogenase (short-subunit alcohol dehydrogenase family)
MRLEGKVALISGAASGMGASTARIFAREGAKVMIADMLDREGQDVADSIVKANGAAAFQHLDVTDEASWREAVAVTVVRFGRLDILVNNAGISGSGEDDTLGTEAWDRLMAVNSRGVFLGTKFAVPEMQHGRSDRPSRRDDHKTGRLGHMVFAFDVPADDRTILLLVRRPQC